jgi:hypothetical protein
VIVTASAKKKNESLVMHPERSVKPRSVGAFCDERPRNVTGGSPDDEAQSTITGGEAAEPNL